MKEALQSGYPPQKTTVSPEHSGLLRQLLTWICILARRSRLRVVYRVQSTPRGICCLSCSKHRFSWALLQGKEYGGQYQPRLPSRRDGKGERDGPWDLVQLGARLGLTCASPAHCAQTCKCQGDEVRGSWHCKSLAPGYRAAQNSPQLSVPGEPFVRIWAHLGHQTPGSDKRNQRSTYTKRYRTTCPGTCGVSP